MIISIIVAVAENGVIGDGNQLIWHLPEDLKHFKRITTGHHIIMGRKTFDSIGRPLPNRNNVIITRNQDFLCEGCIITHSMNEAFDMARVHGDTEVFIIGGGQIYKEALPIADKVYLTRVKASFKGDTIFPELQEEDWSIVNRTDFKKDEKHQYPFSIIEMNRVE